MKAKDITFTTPEAPTPYAVGSIGSYDIYSAQPGFVLKTEGREAVVLTRASWHEPVTPEAEAVQYTLADFELRHATQRQHRYPAWDDETRAARQEAMATLKPIPAGWDVKVLPLSNVRMPWAEYVTFKAEHEQAVKKHAAIRAGNEAIRSANIERINTDLAKRGSTKVIQSYEHGVKLSFEQYDQLIGTL